MREHQIVITLKPNQFARIQQMSKDAGAKSMGIFVRKTLLAALEMDGVKSKLGAPETKEPAKQSGNSVILADLQRLRGELRDLINESLVAAMGISFEPEEEFVSEEQYQEDEESEVADEEPIVSNIRVGDPLEDLLDERLKDRLEMYMENVRKGKPKVPTTRGVELDPTSPEPAAEEPSPEPQPEPAKPDPAPTRPRTIPPSQPTNPEKPRFSGNPLPLSGNPPPKKQKH